MERPTTITAKFWQHVQEKPETGCWVWSGPTGGSTGYPVYGRRAAWRYAYEHLYGPIRKFGRYSVLGSCVGADFCANPDHRIGTPVDQMQARHKCHCGDWHDPEIEQ